MDFDRLTDEQLLAARVQGQSGASFAAFYRRHERLIAAYHLRRVRDVELAADLTAETFAQALAARSRFGPRGPGSGAAWLYGIASNVRASSARRSASERRTVEALGVVRRHLTDDQREQFADLATEEGAVRALDTLAPEQRDAICAYVLDNRPYAEIAAEVGAGESVIRKRVSRGLAVLRRSIEEETS